jgi:methionyl-tRNA formyltransferase
MTAPLRLAFMGTPDFAVPALRALLDSPHLVVAVYTQPPRPSGRGQKLKQSPVHEAAVAAGVEVRHPVSMKPEEEKAAFAALDLDAAVVAAYGLILPKAVLAAPRHGCLNIHGSLLPRWRGAAPIQRAVLEGDNETGVTIMQMEAGLDTGPMLAKRVVPITGDTTSAGLYQDLAAIGAEMIVPVLEGFVAGRILPEPQDDALATLAPKLSREDGRLDWSRPAVELDRQVRALAPWPGTWFEYGGEVVKVSSVTLIANEAEESNSHASYHFSLMGEVDGRSPADEGGGGSVGAGVSCRSTATLIDHRLSDGHFSHEGEGKTTGPLVTAGTILDQRFTIATGSGALRLLEVQRPGKSWIDGATFMLGAGLKPGDSLA